ncbi:Smr/MutS family protein, partial [Synergistaceae bacterium OttesenSCG-928-D05]|nr:Smr/MutS family protein [Synergistaceae bacterium OttesenSCG-928-D05]
PLTKIRIVKQGSEKRELPQVQIKVSRPVGVPSSIMIRGMTIDEAMPMVEQYLDQAYRAGYGSVTIIHGRGEGILRREVQALCKRTSYVADYKLGGAGEGGYGVTVVTFKH